MNFSSKILEDAVQALSALPGIGKKSALRLALHLVQDKTQKSTRISNALTRLENDIRNCRTCGNISDHDVCNICLAPHRKKNIICVVESTRDVMAIEETDQFSGTYHVLGGVISPLDGIGPSDLNIDALLLRIKQYDVDEIIMAISPTIEGETTIYYISRMLQDTGIKVSVIARGVSFGGELEYADELTLGRSIVSRIPYSVQS
ncbi:MAG: recombination protein RecR [Saprospiraceae bacterium]|nr:recombination protein RecR [Saprospiraceae bacterium]